MVEGMPGVSDHRELDVWKLSDELRTRVAEVVARPIFDRHPGLRRQLREAAESAPPNLAEGFSRFYPTDNAMFVRIAKASLTEVIEHLRRAHALKLIESGECEELVRLGRRARGAATRYVIYLESAEAPDSPASRRRPKHKRWK
jgi:four helix bundle protein